jgi:hypothetical protein
MTQRQLRKPRLASSIKEEEDPKLFDAVREIGGLIPKSAGLFVALSAVAYYSGWREGVAYYQKLGAPWIVSTLPRFSFIELSAGTLAIVLITAYWALYHIATVERGVKEVFWLSMVSMGAAVVVWLAPDFVPQSWVTPTTHFLCELAHAKLMYLSVGLLFGEAIARFRTAKLKWSPGLTYSFYLVILYGVYMVPAEFGRARAQLHLASANTTLPLVSIPNSAANEHWRLVEVISQNALLGEFSNDKNPPVFRVVQLKDIATIRQPVAVTVTAKLPPPAHPATGKSAGFAQSTHPASESRS